MNHLDRRHLDHAIQLALASEREGNLPIGALITLDGEVIAEGKSEVLRPRYNPGRHAEIMAIRDVDEALWPRARQMTCYSTLEPCVMCAGALLLHGIGRVVFGARDDLGGAGTILEHLPPYYDQGGVFAWEGPLMQASCEPLYRRADAAFASLPVGRDAWADDEVAPPATTAPSSDADVELLAAWLDDPRTTSLRKVRVALDRLADTLEADQLVELLPFTRALFERSGLLKDYRTLRRIARHVGDEAGADAFRQVQAAVREHLPDIWIKEALRRGEVAEAIDCWFENEEDRRARLCADELLRAAPDDHAELIISCRMSQVSYRIGRGSRRHYRRACAILRRLKDELVEAGQGDYWRYVIEDVTTEHAGRPALLDELEKAGFLEV